MKLFYPLILSVAVLMTACGGGSDTEPQNETQAADATASCEGATCLESALIAGTRLPLGESSNTVTLDGVKFNLFTYKPSGTINGILLVFHGTDRNAADYRRWAEPLAKKAGLAVVAPLFDSARCNATQYNRGNLVPGSSRNTWT